MKFENTRRADGLLLPSRTCMTSMAPWERDSCAFSTTSPETTSQDKRSRWPAPWGRKSCPALALTAKTLSPSALWCHLPSRLHHNPQTPMYSWRKTQKALNTSVTLAVTRPTTTGLSASTISRKLWARQNTRRGIITRPATTLLSNFGTDIMNVGWPNDWLLFAIYICISFCISFTMLT